MRWLPVVWGGAIASGAAGGVVWQPPDLCLQLATTAALLVAGRGLVCGRPRAVVVAAVAGLIAAAWALAAHAEREARTAPLAQRMLDRGDEPVWLDGELAEDASVGAGGVRLRLTLDGGQAALTVGGALALDRLDEWRAARRVRLPARLRRPGRFRNAGVPDHQLAQARRGLVLVGSVKSGALVEVRARGSWPAERAADTRAYARRALAARVSAHPQSAATARAIIIGDRTGLDPGIVDRLQAAGTYHVMAISGGNIAVLAAVIVGLLWLLRVPARLRALLTIGLLAAYAALVGAEPSVVRATIMATAYLALRVADLRTAPLNALGAAAGAMLAASPLSIRDPGFVLTFAATGALVVLTGRLMPRTGSPTVRWVLSPLVASVAAELVLLPIAAVHFNRITVAGLILNLAAVPLMSVVQLAGLMAVLTHDLAPVVASLAGWLAAHAAEGLIRSASLMDVAPWLARRVPAPALWCVALYYVGLLLAFVSARINRVPGRWRVRAGRGATVAVGLAALWIALHPFTWSWPWRADGRLHVTVLDVGQGDATLIAFPRGARLLVDTGGFAGATTFDVGARVVAPALWARGVGSLEALVITHGDPDHIGGAPSVIRDFSPREIWEGVPVPVHAPLRQLREAATAAGPGWRTVYAGSAWTDGRAELRVWHPMPPDWERPRVRNDDSVVIELRMDRVSVVLAGDVGRDVERELAARLPAAPLRVVKAPHHGSASSSSDAFLDALAPALALVSCGLENRYGHPAPAVLARYAERGIPVLRTDRDGAVALETDGRTVWVTTFTGKRLAFDAPTTKPRRYQGTKERGDAPADP